MLGWLRGKKARTLTLTGTAEDLGIGRTFSFQIVGESHTQDTLRSILASGTRNDRGSVEFEALLVPETWNEYDANAVSVHVADSRLVGRFSRDDAAEWSPRLQALLGRGHIGTCRAILIGESRDNLGVVLNLPVHRDIAIPSVPPSKSATPERTAARRRYSQFALNCTDSPLADHRVVVSGVSEIWDREEFEKLLERLGARCANSISGRTTLLIVGSGPGPMKLANAAGRGTRVISEADFIADFLEPARLAWEERRKGEK